ncbi:hypothetical protein L7E55_15655 [Pelotomaculum isophthalicicum JI]|uniref:Type IV pilus assembly protein PilN n=1 Tax=Pelotomaculum isophthalicicum JI TaxID=947010 RepID=A0A9X4H4F2_9FIRM|nr:hypothetical protein [Pelotomaculum isophthalicicum]MDF9409766.1 hypothetical protein [Pelotomaculum isophthalicicum JI]
MNVVIKDIDFLPQRFTLERKKNKQRLLLIMIIFIVAVFAGLSVWVPFKMEKELLAKSKTLDENINMLNRATPTYNQMIAKQKEYEQKKQTVNNLESNVFKVIPFLEKVSEVTPQGVYVSQLAIIADEGVNITFISNSPVETANILVGLRKLDIFQSVNIEEVPFVGNPSQVKFNLRFKWAKEAPNKDTSKDTAKDTAKDTSKDTGKSSDKGDVNAAVKEVESKIKSQ